MGRGWILLGAFVVACNPPPVTAVPTARQQVLLEGVIIDRFEGDRLRDRTAVRRAELDRASGVVRGDQVRTELYGATGPLVPRGELSAEHATSELGPGRVTLEGGVRLADPEGRVVRTERLVYEGPSERISTDAVVSLEGQNFRAQGQGLVGQLDQGIIEIGAPLSARVEPEPRHRGAK